MNLLTEFYVGGYNQYAQEIFDPNSDLYKFNPDLIIIFLDTIAILGDHYFLPYKISDEERRSCTEERIVEITNLAEKTTESCQAKVILHNLEKPIYSPLGLVENKQDIGYLESIEIINSTLRDRFKKNNQVFIFDYDAFCSQIGKQNTFDYKMYYLGDMKLNLKYLPNLCDEYIAYIQSIASMTKKCIVLDLDNTLWGGVIGEDGLEGIKLGPTPEGRPFMEFQKYLLSLFHRGIILAVNSKNNPEDALEVIRNHPYMVLKENHFAGIQINWEDKVTNMRALAKEINIGLDSMVFIDDDNMNREMMKEFIPEVTVVDLPKDSALYVKTLTNLRLFDSMSITKEDEQKGQMYAEEKNRRKLAHETMDLTEYLRKLNVTVVFDKINPVIIPRVAQLTQKTNQFNMTTKRYTEEIISQLVKDNNYQVIAINVADKFGDNGLTGVAIVEKKDKRIWRIDSFLLSCRIIGKKVEETLLAYIIKVAKSNKAHFLRGEFIPSKKNKLAEEFYQKCGFKKLQYKDNTHVWEFDLKCEFPFPDFIEFKINK
jgi:FkbH-like protein